MWAVDIVGILSTSTKQEKYCIVVIDYMTTWVEARPLATITEDAAKKFMQEQVILRFIIPNVCVLDNGTQFIEKNSELSCTTSESNRISALWATLKAMGQLRPQTRSSSMILKRDSVMQKAFGPKNCHGCYGPTERHQGHPREKHPLD
ncbi:uncharacterized protein LOC141699399 [Apium graveolens]|uniref:uncharacterized protein LOC141699399 n=1 Tax=Apium graveolens TaxID=4045 RepID=UPI003D7AEE3F